MNLKNKFILVMFIIFLLFLVTGNVGITNLEASREPIAEQYELKSSVFPRNTGGISDSPYVVGINGKENWQQFAGVVLQGLINRNESSIYLIWDHNDADWLEKYEEIGYDLNIELPVFKSVISIDKLFNKVNEEFEDYVEGLLIYDKSIFKASGEKPLFINIITTIAGKENLIPVPSEYAEKFNLPVVMDIRDKWEDIDSTYRWIVEKYPELVSFGLLAHLHPQTMENRDYLVAFNILPIYYWEGMETRTEELFNEIMIKTGPNQPIIGLWGHSKFDKNPEPNKDLDEHGFRKHTLPYGKYVTVTGRSDGMAIGNLTFHSSLDFVSSSTNPNKSKNKKLNEDKIYITFNMSDGDNVLWFYDSFFNNRWWGNSARGEVPITWSIAPPLVELMPGVLSYYYETATSKDSFISAAGAGYMWLDEYGSFYENRDDILQSYAINMKEYLNKINLNSTWLAFTPPQVKSSIPDLGKKEIEIITKNTQEQINTILLDYGKRPEITYDKANKLINNVSVFHALTPSGRHSAEEIAENIKEQTPEESPAFLHVFLWNWGTQPDKLKKVTEILGSDYTIVDTDTLGDLYMKATK